MTSKLSVNDILHKNVRYLKIIFDVDNIIIENLRLPNIPKMHETCISYVS